MEYRYEHPDCYRYLEAFLVYLESLASRGDTFRPPSDPLLAQHARHIRLESHFAARAGQQPDVEIMRTHLHDWFDALKTRQLIHYVRDERCGTVNAAALAEAPCSEPASRTGELRSLLRQADAQRK